MPSIKREELQPGIWLRNSISRKLGEVRGEAEKPSELMRAHEDFVRVRFRGPTGTYQYPIWALINVVWS